MTTRELPLERAVDVVASRKDSEDCWAALPEVLRVLFQCTAGVPVNDALNALGVDDPNEIVVERVYELERGPLIVSVWHDQVERDADGTIACWIDTFGWRPDGEGPAGDRNAVARRLLATHAGREVYALLLKRGWTEAGAPFAECVTLDIVMWRLEAAGQQWFVLRRPMVRRSDPKRGAAGRHP